MKQSTKKKSAAVAPDWISDYPPFPGFDPVAFKFLRELKKNNNREWFTPEKKAIYESHLVEPMRQLLAELRMRFMEENLPYRPDPKSSMFRIYRDTRFSKDKSPYKTNIGAVVPFASEGKEGIGNYVHIDSGECFYGGGAYFMESPGLKNLRTAIDRDPAKLRKIIEDVESTIGPVKGEQLKRAPAGYPEDHPAIDLLRHKQFWTSRPFDEKLAGSRELVDSIVSMSRDLFDFNRYLHEAIRGVKLE